MPPIRMVGAINTPRAREKVLVNRHRLGDVSAGGTGVKKKAFCQVRTETKSQIMMSSKLAAHVRHGLAQDRLGFTPEPGNLQRDDEIICS